MTYLYAVVASLVVGFIGGFLVGRKNVNLIKNELVAVQAALAALKKSHTD